ncbi:ABC transporter permease [Salinicola salarius]|uniref:ABC transporter permease n=1 Tax=Salinicola salarius TaxID=430457 RepID=UPI0023E42741|nr:ABC transporter permease [Salinicola salarius]MDF3919160.1 ABC transporter permease [Salinicola salarius]
MSELAMITTVSKRARRSRRRSERWIPLWLTGPAAVFFLVLLGMPLLMTLALSFYTFDYTAGIDKTLTFTNYSDVLFDGYFHEIFLRTYGISLVTTVLCALLGAPEAYILYRMRSPWRSIFLLVTLGPLLISVVVRTLGWVLLIGGNGLLSQFLQAVGLVGSRGMSLMYSHTGVVIAMVHVLVPFMVISVWASLRKVDLSTGDAALSLGAKPFTVLRRVIFPQVLPGVLSGSLIVFALTASYFATPSIIGGRRLKVVATSVYDEYLSTMNWPLGASISVVLLVLNVAIVMSYSRWVERRFRRTLGEG